jgi:hypothetical protein
MRASILRESVQGNMRRKCVSCSPERLSETDFFFFFFNKLFRELAWLTRNAQSAGGM